MGPHALRLAFGWSGLGAASLAGLFALRRVYLRRPALRWWRRKPVAEHRAAAALQGLGDFRLHSLAGGLGGSADCGARLVSLAQPWPGITAGLGLFLLAVSGGRFARRAVGCGPAGRLSRPGFSGLRREAERLRLTPSLVEAGEALLQRLSGPPPRLGTGFLPRWSACCWRSSTGYGFGCCVPAALQGLYSKSEVPDIVAQYRQLMERWRRQRLLQLLPTLEAGAELARLIHLPLSPDLWRRGHCPCL